MKKALIVEPEIPENTGFIARLAANFDFQLRIVNPVFNLKEARKTAKNAQQKLRDAEIFGSVEESVEDLDFVVGTRNDQEKKLKNFNSRQNTSIMIGRESTGLTNQELDLCDTTVSIQTSGYSSLNQSHAAAILFHSMSVKNDEKGLKRAQKQMIRELATENMAEAIIESNPSKGKAGKIIEELKK